jgi:hypothetical protein
VTSHTLPQSVLSAKGLIDQSRRDPPPELKWHARGSELVRWTASALDCITTMSMTGLEPPGVGGAKGASGSGSRRWSSSDGRQDKLYNELKVSGVVVGRQSEWGTLEGKRSVALARPYVGRLHFHRQTAPVLESRRELSDVMMGSMVGRW